MDEPRRPTELWLITLSCVLIAEGIAVALVRAPDPLVQPFLALIAVMLGIVMLMQSFRAHANPASWAAPGFAAFSLLGVMVVSSVMFLRPFSTAGVRATLMYFSIPALVLMGAGGALLWAAALARYDHPDHPRLDQLGRIGAGIAQLGFFFAFINEIPSFGRSFDPGAPTFAVNSLVRLVVRILLLWGSVQMMRSASEREVLLQRFVQVHYVMVGWACMMLVNSAAMYAMSSPPFAKGGQPNFLRNLIYVTVIVITAFAFARRFRHLPKEQPAAA